MNEETIIENRPSVIRQQETKKEESAWKQVTIGGVSGILMGAGLLYAGQAVAHNLNKEESPEEKTEDVVVPDQRETSHTLENGLKVAAVNDDLSFGEAFAQARAEVGPGGVFHWHGGIYNTYSADEWNGMTVEQKHDFAEQVQPEILPDELSTPTDADTHVVVVHHVYHQEETPVTSEVHESSQDGDVHIVGYAKVDGHMAMALDMNDDGQADVAIIDINDNHVVDGQDIVTDGRGHVATVDELTGVEQDPYQMTSMENPDVAPDMPDYMNDANVDDMNVLM